MDTNSIATDVNAVLPFLPTSWAAYVSAAVTLLMVLGRIYTALCNDGTTKAMVTSIFLGSSTTTQAPSNKSAPGGT